MTGRKRKDDTKSRIALLIGGKLSKFFHLMYAIYTN